MVGSMFSVKAIDGIGIQGKSGFFGVDLNVLSSAGLSHRFDLFPYFEHETAAHPGFGLSKMNGNSPERIRYLRLKPVGNGTVAVTKSITGFGRTIVVGIKVRQVDHPQGRIIFLLVVSSKDITEGSNHCQALTIQQIGEQAWIGHCGFQRGDLFLPLGHEPVEFLKPTLVLISQLRRCFRRSGRRVELGVTNIPVKVGGEVIGVIPHALANSEVANHDCTELCTVTGMHERKQRFTDLSDGFVTIPGGVGTMDELWEAVSWAQLGYHTKPVGLLNAFGFYDHLIAFNRHMAEVGFVRPAHQGIIIAADTLPVLLDRMASYEPHTPIFSMSASEL